MSPLADPSSAFPGWLGPLLRRGHHSLRWSCVLLLLHVRLAWGRNGVYERFCVSVVANIVVVAAVVVVAVFVRGTLVGGTIPTARSPDSSARPVCHAELRGRRSLAPGGARLQGARLPKSPLQHIHGPSYGLPVASPSRQIILIFQYKKWQSVVYS